MEPEATESMMRRLMEEFVERNRQQMAEVADGLRHDFDGLRHDFDGLRQDFDGLRQHVDSVTGDLRRHFDVVAEDLRGDIRLIAEGHAVLQKGLDELRSDMTSEFKEVRTLLKSSYTSLDRRLCVCEENDVQLESRVTRLEASRRPM